MTNEMSNGQSQRIDDALSSLVDTFLPTIPDEDEETDNERRDNAFDVAKQLIDR